MTSPEETTWENCGLDIVSRAAMRRVSEMYPSGPVAETVRILDSRSARGLTANNCTRPPHFPPHCGCPAGFTQDRATFATLDPAGFTGTPGAAITIRK